MKRPVVYASLGLLAYLISLVATFPAALAHRWAEPLLKGVPVQLEGIEGDIWTGRVNSLHVQRRPLGALSWSLSPVALLLGTLELDWALAMGEGSVQGEARLNRDGELLLNNVKGRVPVQQITRIYPVPMVVVDGLVSVRLDELGMNGQQLTHAQGQLGWHQAEIVAPQGHSLGDLILSLEARKGEGGIRGLFKDQGGPLQAEGEVVLEPNGRYHLNGKVGAREGSASSLGQSLKMLGRPDASGLHQLKFTGKL